MALPLCFDCKDVAVNTVRMCSLIDPATDVLTKEGHVNKIMSWACIQRRILLDLDFISYIDSFLLRASD